MQSQRWWFYSPLHGLRDVWRMCKIVIVSAEAVWKMQNGYRTKEVTRTPARSGTRSPLSGMAAMRAMVARI
jgi:hypothetical protein